MKEGRGNILQIDSRSQAQVDFGNHFHKYFSRVVSEKEILPTTSLPEPRLLRLGDNQVLATGYAGIEKQLNAYVDQINGARAAFLLTISSVLLAYVEIFFPFVQYVALVGGILAYSKGLGCLTCSTGHDGLIEYAALFLFTSSVALIGWLNYREKSYPLQLPSIFAAASLVQIVLILRQPQFCVFCIGMGLCL